MLERKELACLSSALPDLVGDEENVMLFAKVVYDYLHISWATRASPPPSTYLWSTRSRLASCRNKVISRGTKMIQSSHSPQTTVQALNNHSSRLLMMNFKASFEGLHIAISQHLPSAWAHVTLQAIIQTITYARESAHHTHSPKQTNYSPDLFTEGFCKFQTPDVIPWKPSPTPKINISSIGIPFRICPHFRAIFTA